MRVLKIFLTAVFALFAIVAGLVVTAVVALGSVLMLSLQRLLGRPAVTPSVTQPRGVDPAARGDVIEVSATEVRAEPPAP